PADGEKKPHVQIGDLEIDRYRFEVRMKGRPVDLTPKEFELLAILASAPGRVFGREELLDAVWGRDGFVEPRTVDVHVARLLAQPAGAQTLINGAGATFPYPIYSKWFDEYAKIDPEVRFNYQSIGSGGGIKQISSRTVDFGASDGPMTDEQLRQAPAELLHIP